jgi:protein-disulfide isomerase
MAGKSKKSLPSDTLERLVPVLLVLSIALAFVVGVLWQKVSGLEGRSTEVAGTVDDQANAAPDQPQAPPNGKLSGDQAEKLVSSLELNVGEDGSGVSLRDDDHIRGSKDAEVFLIEYSDLECPFCKQFHSTAQQALDEYEGKVAWVYRHFPLDLLHSKARTEALASECAFEQGGDKSFWAFVDKVYEVTPSNDGLNLDDIPDLANQVGLNGSQLQSCVDAEKYKDKVEEEYQGGVTAGVNGTPGNFIINKKGEAWSIPGAVPYESLKSVIDEALQS